MSFLQFNAIYGLVAALAPIVIYLLLRRRRQMVDWGASYLLRLTLRSKRKSSRWKQLVVLACRCALLALAAFLLMRGWRPNPTPSTMTPAMPAAPVHRAILYDNSLSLSAADADQQTRLARQRAAITAILASQRHGDALTLIPLVPDDTSVETHVGPIDSAAADRLLAPLQALREARIDLPAALRRAMPALASTPASEAQIFVFTDLPAELSDQLAPLTALRASPTARRAALHVVNLAGAPASDGGNVVIHGIDAGTDLALAGIPLTLYVDAQSFTDADLVTALEVAVDGTPLTSQPVVFTPNERQQVAIPIVLTEPGSALVQVSTGASRLPAHGTRHASFAVRDRLTVWIAGDDSEPVGEAAVQDTELLARAFAAGGDRPTAVDLRFVSLGDLSREIPAEVDVVILAGPAFGLPAVGEQLLPFVRRGGGLVVAMLPAVKAESYTTSYAALLPAGLGEPARHAVDPESFSLVRAEPEPGSSALFRDLGTERGADFADVRIYNYLETGELAPASQAVFRLANDAPLLLVRQLGRGRVYLLTTSLGIGWTSLPVRQSYLPFLYRLAQAAASGRILPRHLTPGERIVLPWPTVEAVTLESPDGSVASLQAQESASGAFAITDAVTQPGYYRLTGASGFQAEAVVAGEVAEGDLRPLPPAAQQALAAALDCPIHADWPTAVAALGPADAQHRLWPWLLLAMLVIYLFETWFVRHV